MVTGPTFHDDDPVLRELQDVQDRLATLERSRQLENASIKDGSLKIFDDQDRLVAQVGVLDDGTHGLDLYDASSGTRVIRFDAQGAMRVQNTAGQLVTQLGLLSDASFGVDLFEASTGDRVIRLSEDGSMHVDDQGQLIALLGVLGDGSHGIDLFHGTTGASFFKIADDGWWRPWQIVSLGSPDNGQQTTGLSNTSFEERFLADFFVSAEELTLNYSLDVASGDTVEVRFTVEEIATATEQTIETQSKTSSGQYLFEQPHPDGANAIGKNYRFRVKARRSAGSGTYDIGIVTPLVNRPV